MCCSCFVMHYLVTIAILNHLDEEERADCLTLMVFLMSCNCYVALLHSAVGLL